MTHLSFFYCTWLAEATTDFYHFRLCVWNAASPPGVTPVFQFGNDGQCVHACAQTLLCSALLLGSCGSCQQQQVESSLLINPFLNRCCALDPGRDAVPWEGSISLILSLLSGRLLVRCQSGKDAEIFDDVLYIKSKVRMLDLLGNNHWTHKWKKNYW